MGLMPAESSTEQLGHRELVWLVIGIGLAVLPHCTRLPVWIPLLHYCLTLLRLIIPNLELSQIYNTTFILIRQLVMVAALFGVYGSYGTLVGRDAGIALLVVLSGFKVLESKESRDFYIACFLGYFLIITNFIYTQSIPTAIFMFAVIVIMTVSLITYNDSGKQLLITSRLRLSGALLFQALPIMLILFLLFPRVTGPLWGLPKDQIPKPAQLYWRGPVLWFSDGHKWTAGRKKYGRSPAPINTFGQPVRYEITLEPTNKYWLFALEIPTYIPEQSYLTYDLQLKTKLPVRVRKQYTLVSYTNFLIGTGHPAELQRALQLPEGHHNKTIQLARAWRQESNSPGEIIGRALHWFKNDNFYYTQTPPPLHRDSVDEFLFSTKQGFCEHYAMAFVVLMRAAGIPARVVTGYQGGEFNPVGNYLIVRQRDAHAWAEVWLGKEGWQRVDPTAAVSPARIDQGIDNALPNSIFDIPLGLESSIIARDLWQRFQNTWDAINYQWNQWILSYGPKRQTQFLSQFGLGRPDWRGMTMGLMVMVGLIIVCMAIWLFRQQPLATDPARRAYEQFCNKLARQGMVRGMSEGPVDFAQRSSTRRADLAREINRITTLYIEIRYGSQTDRLKSLKYLIRKFDTGRRQ
jgi:transglutaminase-like putative cysteine protease